MPIKADPVRDVCGEAPARARKANTMARKAAASTQQGKWKRKSVSRQTLSSTSRNFDAERGYCEKWGHKRADCRKRIKVDSGIISVGAPAHPVQLVNAQGGTRAFRFLVLAGDDTSWICVLSGVARDSLCRDRDDSIFIESGSDEHDCRPTFAPLMWSHCLVVPVPDSMCSSNRCPRKDTHVCSWSCWEV